MENQMNKITVEIKTKYGKQVVYPISKEARLFAKIAGKITLTGHTLNLIKRLGYEVVVLV